MSDPVATVRTRVDPSSRTAAIAVGDLVAILGFVVAGEYAHSYGPLSNPERVVGVAAPFVIGWVLLAVAGGLYTRDATANVRRVVSWTVPAWVASVVVAQLLRGTAVFPGDASLVFGLVSVGVGGTAVVGWRLLVAVSH